MKLDLIEQAHRLSGRLKHLREVRSLWDCRDGAVVVEAAKWRGSVDRHKQSVGLPFETVAKVLREEEDRLVSDLKALGVEV